MNYTIENITENKDVSIKVLEYFDIDSKLMDISILTERELSLFTSFKSNKRQLEYYFARVLWQSFKIYEEINYKPSGKPIINNGFISISHSNHQVAIAFSTTKEIGMDLEQNSDKVQRIKSKYLHKDENYNSINELTKVWTIKEAIYKLYDSKSLFFKDHILIKSIHKSVETKVILNGKIVSPKVINLELKNNFSLTYAQ